MPRFGRSLLLLWLPLACPTTAISDSPGIRDGFSDSAQQEDVPGVAHQVSIAPELPTTRQLMNAQVAALLAAQGLPSLGDLLPTPPPERGVGTVRELSEIDTDGNGSIDTHVFWTRVFDSQGNRTLLLEEWDYAPFGALEGRYAEIDDYDAHGNLIRHRVELNDPPQGSFDAKFLTTITYDEHAALPQKIMVEWDRDADGTVDFREVATFQADDQHHLVRMDREQNGAPYSVTTWAYAGNGDLTRAAVVTQQPDDYPLAESWDYTYDARHRVVKTIYHFDGPGASRIFSTTVELDEHGLVLSSVASLDYDDNAGVLERTATKNTYDQRDNLLRTDVLVTDNGHNDEFRSQSSAISEYDDRGRITRRVLDTEVDPHSADFRIVDTFTYQGDDVRAVTERDWGANGTIDSRSILTTTSDPQGRVVHSALEQDYNGDGKIDWRWLRSFEYQGNPPQGDLAGPETGAVLEDSAHPATLGLRLASPNPFHDSIALRFSLQQRSRVELAIYDTAGRRVRTLLQGVSEPGAQSFDWDGRNDAGRMAPSGLFFGSLTSEGSRTLVRLLKLP